ncbi:hypothetical protein E2C01_091737 [Portunus trituberculatus]|uniref:Uncharacterized protein n=1 Tax=Portunus trituberculatus TaxID=210409 RepID=A0A5B7JPF5_PORTR|nr:hypothetical protein [Portunus trituberculatus]
MSQCQCLFSATVNTITTTTATTTTTIFITITINSGSQTPTTPLRHHTSQRRKNDRLRYLFQHLSFLHPFAPVPLSPPPPGTFPCIPAFQGPGFVSIPGCSRFQELPPFPEPRRCRN